MLVELNNMGSSCSSSTGMNEQHARLVRIRAITSVSGRVTAAPRSVVP